MSFLNDDDGDKNADDANNLMVPETGSFYTLIRNDDDDDDENSDDDNQVDEKHF